MIELATLQEAVNSRVEGGTYDVPNNRFVLRSGWDFVLGDGDSSASKTINIGYDFNTENTMVAFANFIGFKDSTDPVDIHDQTGTSIYYATARVFGDNTDQIQLIVRESDGNNIAVTRRIVISWLVIGEPKKQ